MNLAILDQDWSALRDTRLLTLEVSKDATVHCFQVDIRDADKVLETMHQVQSVFGRIDYAVNCAGQ